jgi:hypothetical protein
MGKPVSPIEVTLDENGVVQPLAPAATVADASATATGTPPAAVSKEQ